jgi:hypothetical protein
VAACLPRIGSTADSSPAASGIAIGRRRRLDDDLADAARAIRGSRDTAERKEHPRGGPREISGDPGIHGRGRPMPAAIVPQTGSVASRIVAERATASSSRTTLPAVPAAARVESDRFPRRSNERHVTAGLGPRSGPVGPVLGRPVRSVLRRARKDGDGRDRQSGGPGKGPPQDTASSACSATEAARTAVAARRYTRNRAAMCGPAARASEAMRPARTSPRHGIRCPAAAAP